MTDLMPPPEDLRQQYQWALRTLREWSRPEYQGLLGREEILQGARQILKAHRRANRWPRPLPKLNARSPRTS